MQCFLSGSLVETGLFSGVTGKADLWKILQSNRPLLSGRKARTGVGTTPRMGVANTGGQHLTTGRKAVLHIIYPAFLEGRNVFFKMNMVSNFLMKLIFK